MGLDDAIAFVGGGTVNVAMQALAARATGQSLTLGQIMGAFVSGGTIGVGVVDIPETGGLSLLAATRLVAGPALVNGSVGGALGNLTKQGLDLASGQQTGFNGGDFLLDTSATGLFNIGLEGLLPNANIQGLTRGQGNLNAIRTSIQTKLSNGTIQNVSLRTALRSVVGGQAANTYRNAGGAAFDSARNKRK